jgi:uncharacterized protein YegL
MPRLNDTSMQNNNLPGGSYTYSAVRLENLGATEYTLVTIIQDVSGSVDSFKTEMEKCLAEIVRACIKSPRADNLLIRFVQFGSDIEEVHGFKLLSLCNPDDYLDSLVIRGTTALYDATENGISATADYSDQLYQADYDSNGIVFIITDGMDNNSTETVSTVKRALNETMQKERLESLVTILVGVGTGQYPEVAGALSSFKNDAGLTQFIELKNADAATLAGLADFVSQSISSQSQALGTGGPSKQIPLTI